jgi:hypothetical protein
MLAKHPDGKVTCLICGKTLSNSGAGKRHYINTHQPAEQAMCNICEKTYKNMHTMKVHIKRDHGMTYKEAISFEEQQQLTLPLSPNPLEINPLLLIPQQQLTLPLSPNPPEINPLLLIPVNPLNPPIMATPIPVNPPIMVPRSLSSSTASNSFLQLPLYPQPKQENPF